MNSLKVGCHNSKWLSSYESFCDSVIFAIFRLKLTQHPQYQQQNPSYPPVNYRGNEHYQAAPQTQQFHPYSSPIPPPVSQYAPAYQRPQSPVAATPANGSVSQMQSRYTQPQYQQSKTQIDVSQDQELVLTADPTNAVRQQPAIANSNSAKTYAVEQASYQQPAATVSQ